MKKETRGGPREGAGRPRKEPGAQKRRNITLSDRLSVKAKMIGCGNISEGIRKALEAFSSS
jgi:hypothetical protein